MELLNSDTDGTTGQLINLETFYTIDPKNIPDELRSQYEQERKLAKQLEDYYNKYRNDQYTKQLILNFGYFSAEIPITPDDDVIDIDDQDEDHEIAATIRIDKYPLFSVPVRIEKEIKKGAAKYILSPDDSEIQVNVGMLEPVLGRDLYYQALEAIRKHEIGGKLTLPIVSSDVFTAIWHDIKALLRSTEVRFDEESFRLDEMRIAITSKANYFLAEDLGKLSELEEGSLLNSALLSWITNEELNLESAIPGEQDLYFPFPYDKFQLHILSLLSNHSAIVQGPPGTGKSQTIANLLCHLAATGKRVLFVSQKAQALKVVKDKLKELGIQYLYAYLPNPRLPSTTEEDEIDGIGPELSRLEAHVEDLGFSYDRRTGVMKSRIQQSESVDSNHGKQEETTPQLRDKFSKTVDTEREFFKLLHEFNQIRRYHIPISDPISFMSNFDLTVHDEILSLKREIDSFTNRVSQYATSKREHKHHRLFPDVEPSEDLCLQINFIKRYLSTSGHASRPRWFRALSKPYVKWRLRSARATLPARIASYIDHILYSDIPSQQAENELQAIIDYVEHLGRMKQLKQSQELLRTKLRGCGLSEQQHEAVGKLIEDHDQLHINDIKQNIVRAIHLNDELEQTRPHPSPSLNHLCHDLKQAKSDRCKRITTYICNLIDSRLIGRFKTDARAGAVVLRRAIRRLAKTLKKSKRAFHTFDKLRNNPEMIEAIIELIPIWIMELDDASRILPLKPALFDYLILDEASQCNIAYTLPAMYRSKHALFVGDSEQMRDNTVLFKSNRSFDELAKRYNIIDDLQIKATGEPVQSVLDIAALRGFRDITLRYHYRGPSQLIGFSNKYFYTRKGRRLTVINSNYLPWKETSLIMCIHEIKPDKSLEISERMNYSEALEILELFKEIRRDERYCDKSVGIVSFFNQQAACIREIFEEEGLKEERDNFKISIVEGIQGEEKDIIIFLFVIRSPDQKNRYLPLTGEGGDIRGAINKGRVNVAFSRARLQVHCFTSLPIIEIPHGIWIRKYLEYIKEFGGIECDDVEVKPFDSGFEEEFYHLIKGNLPKEFKIENQVKSCGFKIDFVLTNSKNGNRLAIECDGPTHFENEMDEEIGVYIESDLERQEILEAAGWPFYRIKYSDWIDRGFNRNMVIREIIDILE